MNAIPRWEHFDHEADIGVRGIGRSLEEAFVYAALALTAVMTDPAGFRPDRVVTIACEAADPELLLVDWLNGVIYHGDTERLCFGRFDVNIRDVRLTGRAWGARVDAVPDIAVAVKGASYAGLRVTCDHGVWTAQCIVDV